MRMYFFTMYNLSGIQKGIQAGHAALEYVLEHGNKDDELRDFIEQHKTFIILNGGGSITMQDRVDELRTLGIRYSTFQEPSLNNSLSAIAFLVDEDDYNDGEFYKQKPIKQYLNKFPLALN